MRTHTRKQGLRTHTPGYLPAVLGIRPRELGSDLGLVSVNFG